MQLSSHFWLHAHLPAHLFFLMFCFFVYLSYGVLFVALALLHPFSCCGHTHVHERDVLMLRFHFLFHCIVFYYFIPRPPPQNQVDGGRQVIASVLYLVHYMLYGAVGSFLLVRSSI